jgi:RNA polymerase sigma factor (sigma-70 family)
MQDSTTAWEATYHTYRHRVRRYLVRAHWPTDEIDDGVQDVFALAIGHGHVAPPPEGWRVLLECCREVNRTRARRIRVDEHLGPGAPVHARRDAEERPGTATPLSQAAVATDDDDSIEPEELDRVRAVVNALIAKLPAQQRRAVTLIYLQELSRFEAARRLGCVQSTLRVHLKRALDSLRRHEVLNDAEPRSPSSQKSRD